jgi:hypothetical protein
MSRRLIIRSEAEADLIDAAVWYDSREPGLGRELISEAEVHSAITRALRNPDSFTRVRRLGRFTHRWDVNYFFSLSNVKYQEMTIRRTHWERRQKHYYSPEYDLYC